MSSPMTSFISSFLSNAPSHSRGASSIALAISACSAESSRTSVGIRASPNAFLNVLAGARHVSRSPTCTRSERSSGRHLARVGSTRTQSAHQDLLAVAGEGEPKKTLWEGVGGQERVRVSGVDGEV